MGSVLMVARSELRRRFAGTVVATLLVAVVGTVVLAALAGARRSDSALARFNAWSRSSDVEFTANATPSQIRAVSRIPNVADVALVRTFGIQAYPDKLPNIAMGATIDGRLGTVVDRARLIHGRIANPNAADEIDIGESLSRTLHLGIGDTFVAVSYTPAQVRTFITGGNGGPPKGPHLHLRIVGIVRRPLDLGDRGAAGGVVVLTPGFYRKYNNVIGSWSGDAFRVRTQHGDRDVTAVLRATRRMFAHDPTFTITGLAIEKEGARNAINAITVALVILAAVAAVAGLVSIAIVLTREASLASVDQAGLRALGATRRQRFAASGSRMAIVTVGGAVLAGIGAIAASPLFPFGVARRADPDAGLHADWLVIASGVAVVALTVAAVAFVATWRSTRPAAHRDHRTAARWSARVADLANAAGLPPTASTGVRMSAEAGSGAAAVPLRSAFIGSAFGVLGLVAVLLFGASLGRLASTPPRYGWNWDFRTAFQGPADCSDPKTPLTRLAGVGAITEVCNQSIFVDDHPTSAFAYQRVRGSIAPTIVAGRAARGPGEIVLGSQTMSAIHKSIGDSVHVRGSKGVIVDEIVGRTVFAAASDGQPLADGALLTPAGLAATRAPNDENWNRYFVARYAPGADPAAVDRRVLNLPYMTAPKHATEPVEIARLRQVNWLPVVLAVLVGALALVAVAHALITGVRRRRRELGLLKALGFQPRQVRSTVAWQANVLAAVGLLIGLPAGILVGVEIWRRVADGLGVSTSATLPLIAIPAVFVVVLLSYQLIAYLPARAASRTLPAVALRSE